MTDRPVGPDPDPVAERLARLRARRAAAGARPAPPPTSPDRPRGGSAGPAARRPWRRRRHVAAVARRSATGMAAAGTLGLVAGLALAHGPSATATPTTPVFAPAAEPGSATTGTGVTSRPDLPRGAGQPSVAATAPSGTGDGSTHGSR